MAWKGRGAGRKKRFNPGQAIETLIRAEGINRRAADLLGCSPQTIANYIARYPEIAAAKQRLEDDRMQVIWERLGSGPGL